MVGDPEMILSEVDRKKKSSCVLSMLVTSLFEVFHLHLNGNNQVAKLCLASYSESSSFLTCRLEGMRQTFSILSSFYVFPLEYPFLSYGQGPCERREERC